MSASSKPGWKRGSLAVSAISAVRWPPAEPPVTQTKSGSTPYSSACSRIHARPRLQSTRWSGKVAAGAEPVVDVEPDPALGGQVVEQRDALLALVADHPAAAVDLQERRAPGAARRDRRGRHGDVEAQVPCRRRGRTRCSATRADALAAAQEEREHDVAAREARRVGLGLEVLERAAHR